MTDSGKQRSIAELELFLTRDQTALCKFMASHAKSSLTEEN